MTNYLSILERKKELLIGEAMALTLAEIIESGIKNGRETKSIRIKRDTADVVYVVVNIDESNYVRCYFTPIEITQEKITGNFRLVLCYNDIIISGNLVMCTIENNESENIDKAFKALVGMDIILYLYKKERHPHSKEAEGRFVIESFNGS